VCFKEWGAEEGAGLVFDFTERPAQEFDIFRKSTAYHRDECPVRCPLYEGSYRAEDCRTPVAADILKRVIYTGVVEAPPDRVAANAEALRRVIARIEG
jgi:hypothetical protein